MRRLVFILCILCVVMPCCANEAADLIAPNDTENLIFMMNDALLAELKPIKERLAIMDADFVSYVESETPAQQVRLIRGWLAQKSFEYYDEKYNQMLDEASKSTGRIIKTETKDLGNGMYQESAWLDRGELDNEDKCYNLLERRACDYPDGFEEFSVVKNIGGGMQNIYASIDDIDSNTHYEILILLASSASEYKDDNLEQFMGSIFLNATIDEYEYDEWYAWRNQEMADVRAGKYILDENEQVDPNSLFGGPMIQMDESREWESSNIPKSRAHGRSRDFYEAYTHTVTGIGNEQ